MTGVLAQLAKLGAAAPSTRLADPVFTLAAERALHVAAEAIFDVGHHVLAGRGLPVPATYREIVPALVAAGVLSANMSDRLAGLAGLRNLLVHDYAEIDPLPLWQLIDERLADLEEVHRQLSSLAELTAYQA